MGYSSHFFFLGNIFVHVFYIRIRGNVKTNVTQFTSSNFENEKTPDWVFLRSTRIVRPVLTVQSEKRFSEVGTFGEIATFGGYSVYITALLWNRFSDYSFTLNKICSRQTFQSPVLDHVWTMFAPCHHWPNVSKTQPLVLDRAPDGSKTLQSYNLGKWNELLISLRKQQKQITTQLFMSI